MSVVGLTGIAGAIYGQVTNSRPQFDAASVKLSSGGPIIPGVTWRLKGGPGTGSPTTITYTRVSLAQVLSKAWDLHDYQIVGPAWLKVSRGYAEYTIRATLPTETTQQQFQLMLQDLIVQRIRMRFHRETKRISGYELVVAKNGPKLKESANISEPDSFPVTGVDKQGFPLLPPGHGVGVALINGTHVKFQGYTMADLVDGHLSLFVEGALDDAVPIIDKTGLTGKYDFTLVFANQGGRVVSPGVMPAGAPAPSGQGREAPTAGTIPSDPSGLPDIFNAVEKQLGLRLVKHNQIPIDAMVIDHIEKVAIEN